MDKRNNWFRVAGALCVAGLALLVLSPYAQYCQQDEANQYYCAVYELTASLAAFVEAHNGAITALASLAVAWFTWTLWQSSEKMWVATKLSADIAERSAVNAERALNAVQRAFVVPVVQLVPTRENNKFVLWRVLISIENTGNTQTKNLRWATGSGINLKSNPNFVERDIPYKGNDTGRGFLSPKSSLTVVDAILPRSKMIEVTKSKGGGFFLGRVDYEDIFGTPHMTKFCVSVYGPPWRPSMPDAALDVLLDTFEFGFRMCHCNNCIDEECPEYKYGQGTSAPAAADLSFEQRDDR